MNIPNIWGQGQIFAFSALDGDSFFSSEFAGMLSADRIGVRFNTKIVRELAVVGIETRSLYFKAVTGDYICAVTQEGDEIIILYHDTNTIIGQLSRISCAVALVDGKAEITRKDVVELQDTGDGDFTALATEGNRFCYAYGKSAELAEERARRGLTADMDAAVAKKLAYYEKHAKPVTEAYGTLYNKCLSVMKTQLFSPEGQFKYIWSVPERMPHQDLYLWDSVFHALGFRHIDKKLAEELILDIFESQYENGMIPHRANITRRSDVSQPTVIAWGAWKLFEETGNIEFLRTVFDHNKKFLDWCYAERRCKGQTLFTWDTNDEVTNRCDESGIDNSPRFDEETRLLAIDFACYVANDLRYMSKMAEVLGKDKQIFEDRFQEIKNAVNDTLWDEEDGFYYDYDLDKGKLHKVESFCSFLPLFAGLCDEKQAEKLVGWLTDPEKFATELPVPSISRRDKLFEKDMWRGPVWIEFNYMFIEGLKEYGYIELSNDIREKTLRVMEQWYKQSGCLFEFYDCDNEVAPYKLDRKGTIVEPYNFRIKFQSIRDFGWSATLTCDMIASINK